MKQTKKMSVRNITVNFEIDEILEIKGLLFKVVLVDAFTDKIALRRITAEEAKDLRNITA